MATPITLKLYKDEENPQTFTRSFIPWELLKEAVRLEKSLDAENVSEGSIDELAGLIVAVFGDQFSVADLDKYADLGEMIGVINQILAKARESGIQLPNPTRAG